MLVILHKYVCYYSVAVHVSEEKAQEALSIFRKRGGLLRTSEARKLGIHPRVLYHLRDTGQLDKLSRGLYRVADLPPLSYPDLTVVAARSDAARICLISALDFHDLTSEVPHAVDVALPGSRRPPALDRPPIRAFRMSGEALTEGVEHRDLGGADVKIYGPAKPWPTVSSSEAGSGWTRPLKGFGPTWKRAQAGPKTLCTTPASAGWSRSFARM